MSYIDYELAAELEVDTPERLKALGDPLRSMICDLVLQQAMSVTELSEALDRPRGTIAHHVQVLVDADLVKVVRTRKVRAMTERFYGRTARTYLLNTREGELPFIGEVEREYPAEPSPTPHTNRDGLATLRHVRISPERFEEYVERLEALALEFSAERPTTTTTTTSEYAIYLLAFRTTRFPR